MNHKLVLTTILIATIAVSLTAYAAPCPLNPTIPSVTICSPGNGATVNSPVNIVAAPNDNSGIIAMAIYVDNTLAYKQNVSQINTSINMSPGNHYVVVQAWDNAGRIPKASVNIAVSTAPPPPTVTFSASPASISSGQSSTLSWSTTNATSVSIDNGIGTQSTNGSVAVSPTATTSYTITATGPGGSKTATTTVTVGSTSPLPTINFTASPSTIAAGQSSTLSWNTTNATSVTVDNGIGAEPTSGSIAVSPGATTTYTLTATGPGGTSTARATVTVSTTSGPCPANPTVPSFHICTPANGSTVSSPVRIMAAPSSSRTVVAIAVYVDNTLAYKQNVATLDTSITMSNGNHYVVAQFWDNAGAVTKASVNITVSQTVNTPTISLTASPTSINSGQSSTLTWSSTNVSSLSIDNGIGSVSPNGAVTVNPIQTTTYTATATGTDGTTKVTSSATVTVGSTSSRPTVTMTANPTTITAGGTSTLSWSSSDATSLSIDNGIGSVGTSGTKIVSPAATATYHITATGPGGTATATATVAVGAGSSCTPGSANPSVTICSPVNGGVVASPVHIQAVNTNSHPIIAMAIYVDNSLAFKQNVSSVDTNVNMANGSHYVVVQSWDSTGAVTKASVNITVNPNASTTKFTGTPELIDKGQTATLAWTIPNATSVSIDNGVGNVASAGSQVVTPAATTTYSLSATTSNGPLTITTTISVAGTIGTGGINNINHIIFVLQENRSFDNYFGMMNKYRATNNLPGTVDGFTLDASGVPTNSESNYANNGRVAVFHMLSMCTENLSPSWNESHVSANRFNPSSDTMLNDGILYVAAKNARDTGGKDVEGLRSMGYYDWNDLPYYYFMASQFSMSDRWFSPVSANTNPNRHYMYAATSDGHSYPWVGGPSLSPTIWDRLTAAGISWKVYVQDFQDTVFYEFVNAQNYGDHIFPMQKYFDDLAAGTLPQVVTLETNGLNEHPENNIQQGAAFIKSAVDALQASQYWKDSAFILSYDEFGGLYDHVPPRLTVSPDGKKPLDLKSGDVPGDFTRTGFRVPLVVISPFAKPHYISHTEADHTAILKFIEKRFALKNLNARDSKQIDMTEFFDFNNPLWMTPPSPPVQPTSGPCYFDHLP